MPGLMAISIEKYATTPELGKVSYENGLEEVGCMVILSLRLSIGENDALGIENLSRSTGNGGIS